jgi:hypothetical protein
VWLSSCHHITGLSSNLDKEIMNRLVINGFGHFAYLFLGDRQCQIVTEGTDVCKVLGELFHNVEVEYVEWGDYLTVGTWLA